MLQDTIKDFERNLTDMVGSFVENIQSLTAKCRELEREHHESVVAICVRLLDKVIKTELNDELAEELQDVSRKPSNLLTVFVSFYYSN